MARAKTEDDTIYVATATGVVRIGDTDFHYVAGKTRVRAGHPVRKIFPEKFRAEALDTEKIVAIPSVNAQPRAVRAPASKAVAEVPVVAALPEVEAGEAEPKLAEA